MVASATRAERERELEEAIKAERRVRDGKEMKLVREFVTRGEIQTSIFLRDVGTLSPGDFHIGR